MKTLTKINVAEYKSKVEFDPHLITVDIRSTQDFINGFIPESLHIPTSKLEKYLELVASEGKEIVIISGADPTSEELASIQSLNNNQIKYYLDGGFPSWEAADEEIDIIIDIETDEFKLDYKFDDNILLLDVRNEANYADGHIYKAENFPVKNMTDILYISDIDTDKNIYIHCGGGSSSVLVASYFKKHGIHNVYVLLGGYKELVDSNAFDIITPNTQVLPDDDDLNEESENENK